MDEKSERENRKEIEIRKKEENSKNIKKKENEDWEGRRKNETKIFEVFEYFTCMPGSKIAYLVGETEDRSCELPGTARTARPSSPSSSTSSTKSTRSTAAQEPLPPSDKRSSSPDLIVTNGSTLCAQYRQLYSADFLEREDDRNCERLMCVGQWDTAADIDNRNCGNHQQKTEI